jgi:hypothetical protein
MMKNENNFERIICDSLWDIKQNYPNIELSKHLFYIDTFERLGYGKKGIEITLNNNDKYIITKVEND